MIKAIRRCQSEDGRKVDPHLWVDQYSDYLYSWAMSRINDREAARDLVQETFLTALEKIKDFEGRSTEKTWLTAILKYKILEFYRTKTTVINKLVSISGRDFFQEDGHFHPNDRPRQCGMEEESTLDKKEFEQVLSSCLKKLPSLWHSVFTMKFMREGKAPLICEKLKLSSANYWVIMHRAKINLRGCLQDNWS